MVYTTDMTRETFATLTDVEVFAKIVNKQLFCHKLIGLQSLYPLKAKDSQCSWWWTDSSTCPCVGTVIANNRVKAVIMDHGTCLRMYVNNKGFKLP